MRYIKHILLPNEEVLYDGHVHPRVLLPGILWIGLSAMILIESANTGGGQPILLTLFYNLARTFPSMAGLYNLLTNWQNASPNTALGIKLLASGVALFGLYKLIKQYIIMQTTELVVTNQRIIAKIGVFTIETHEMDRHRVAGVTVDQTFMGRIMGYGTVFIQGFTTSIGGLPILVNPHLVERFIA